jgi:hypothetical protein
MGLVWEKLLISKGNRKQKVRVKVVDNGVYTAKLGEKKITYESERESDKR